MNDFNPQDAIAIPTITGWVQMVKKYLPDSWNKTIPLIAIACGLFYAFAAKPPGPGAEGWKTAILGIVLGLTACGAFSALKSAAEKKEESKP